MNGFLSRCFCLCSSVRKPQLFRISESTDKQNPLPNIFFTLQTIIAAPLTSHLPEHNPPIPNSLLAHRIPRSHHPRRLGRILPLHRRAVLRPLIPHNRQAQPLRSPHPQTHRRNREIRHGARARKGAF